MAAPFVPNDSEQLTKISDQILLALKEKLGLPSEAGPVPYPRLLHFYKPYYSTELVTSALKVNNFGYLEILVELLATQPVQAALAGEDFRKLTQKALGLDLYSFFQANTGEPAAKVAIKKDRESQAANRSAALHVIDTEQSGAPLHLVLGQRARVRGNEAKRLRKLVAEQRNALAILNAEISQLDAEIEANKQELARLEKLRTEKQGIIVQQQQKIKSFVPSDMPSSQVKIIPVEEAYGPASSAITEINTTATLLPQPKLLSKPLPEKAIEISSKLEQLWRLADFDGRALPVGGEKKMRSLLSEITTLLVNNDHVNGHTQALPISFVLNSAKDISGLLQYSGLHSLGEFIVGKIHVITLKTIEMQSTHDPLCEYSDWQQLKDMVVKASQGQGIAISSKETKAKAQELLMLMEGCIRPQGTNVPQSGLQPAL
jgi:hypothetical protein